MMAIKQDDIPEPDDDESQEDFMDRCTDELLDGGADEDEASGGSCGAALWQ